jgi:glutamate/tyrosine decarboxylase-like PLP-dependent enzyme
MTEERVSALSGAELNLSPAQMKELMDVVATYIVRYQTDVLEGRYPATYVHDSSNAVGYEQGKQLAAALREPDVPEVGTELQVLLEQLFDSAMACGTMHPHPGFMGHVPCGGLFQGAVGAFIARAVNRFAGVWVAAPGLIELECNVIRWFCRMLGYGEDAFGYLTTGGSIANLMGMLCGRYKSEESGDGRPVVYTSAQAHYSVAKAARMIGISTLRVIETYPDCSMNVEMLAECIERDRAQGLSPACVVATAGTTNTGAIDDLVRIAAVCRARDVWLHADACFGGFFRITQRGRTALAGIEEADSIAVDAHKSLFLPHGSSALLVKDRARLKAAFEIPGAPYVAGLSDERHLIDFCNYGPELSREIRGLTAWLPLKLHGIRAFERCLDEKLDLAEYLAEQLTRLDGIRVVALHPRHLPVVIFKLHGADRAAGNDDALNQRLCELICARGNAYLTTTKVAGHGVVLRVCILHVRTDAAVVNRLLADVQLCIRELVSR